MMVIFSVCDMKNAFWRSAVAFYITGITIRTISNEFFLSHEWSDSGEHGRGFKAVNKSSNFAKKVNVKDTTTSEFVFLQVNALKQRCGHVH